MDTMALDSEIIEAIDTLERIKDKLADRKIGASHEQRAEIAAQILLAIQMSALTGVKGELYDLAQKIDR